MCAAGKYSGTYLRPLKAWNRRGAGPGTFYLSARRDKSYTKWIPQTIHPPLFNALSRCVTCSRWFGNIKVVAKFAVNLKKNEQHQKQHSSIIVSEVPVILPLTVAASRRNSWLFPTQLFVSLSVLQWRQHGFDNFHGQD